jgi:hypothetical protein
MLHVLLTMFEIEEWFMVSFGYYSITGPVEIPV